jgi:hypothetical protein
MRKDTNIIFNEKLNFALNWRQQQGRQENYEAARSSAQPKKQNAISKNFEPNIILV